MSYKKELWINIAKFVAILGVIMDHSYKFLYYNENLLLVSYFAVTMFIFISGITIFYSNDRNDCKYFLEWIRLTFKRVKKIVIPYLIATAIYQIIEKQSFDIQLFFNNVILFNVCPPMYYILLYIQLLIIAPLLYVLIKKANNSRCKFVNFIMLTSITLVIGCWSNLHTNIADIYGGGGKILGGTFLFVFLVGMLWANFVKEKLFLRLIKKSYAMIVVAIICVVWLRFYFHYHFLLDVALPMGKGVTPPNITIFIGAMLAIMVIYLGVTFLEQYNYTPIKKLLNGIGWLGAHTLYIFMYHWIIVVEFLRPYINFSNSVLQALVHISIMVIVPVIIEHIFYYIRRRLA